MKDQAFCNSSAVTGKHKDSCGLQDGNVVVVVNTDSEAGSYIGTFDGKRIKQASTGQTLPYVITYPKKQGINYLMIFSYNADQDQWTWLDKN